MPFNTPFFYIDKLLVSSSSIRGNQQAFFRPDFAADNCYKDVPSDRFRDLKIFMSEFEDFPWFQWQIYRKPKKIEEVVIVIPRRVYNKLEKRMLDDRYEVRAGLDKIGNSFRGQITKNEVCDSYRPDNPNVVKGDYAKYVFPCNRKQDFIKASYVTVQI